MNQNNTDKKIEAMTSGGKKLSKILSDLLEFSDVGVRLLDVEALAQKRIKEEGGLPSFTTVEDYKWATCLCINDVIVHGIPTARTLANGDVFTIDIGMIYQGFHTDTAWTKIIGKDGNTERCQAAEKFLSVGKEALKSAISQAQSGNRIGHISEAIQKSVEGAGYGVVKSLIGHGVGEELHMSPQVPGYLRGGVDVTPKLTPGMTIAVEVIYTMGNPAVYYINDDGWSIATRDHSLSAVFEESIAISDHGPIELTPIPVKR